MLIAFIQLYQINILLLEKYKKLLYKTNKNSFYYSITIIYYYLKIIKNWLI